MWEWMKESVEHLVIGIVALALFIAIVIPDKASLPSNLTGENVWPIVFISAAWLFGNYVVMFSRWAVKRTADCGFRCWFFRIAYRKQDGSSNFDFSDNKKFEDSFRKLYQGGLASDRPRHAEEIKRRREQARVTRSATVPLVFLACLLLRQWGWPWWASWLAAAFVGYFISVIAFLYADKMMCDEVLHHRLLESPSKPDELASDIAPDPSNIIMQ